MEVPKGLDIEDNKKLILRKTIYDRVQISRKFYDKLIHVLKVIGLHGSKSDLCLWTMWDEKVNHMKIIGIYVKDFLIIGKEKTIDHLIDELKIHEFNLKVERNVYEYLSCCIEESKDERKLTMIQLHFLTCLIKKVGEEIEGKRKFLTPGTPRFKIQRSTINMDVLDTQSQRKYRSGIGMLLYSTKYSQPDTSNIFQECSVTWGAYNQLLRVIKFVSDTKTFGLKVQPRLYNNLGWDLKIFCDSNWAGDPETRVSMMGFIIYLLNVPICWRSKSQKE
jgi:hypothetical protein